MLCEKLCKSGARGGCWLRLGEALGGCSPPLGGSMGCMHPHTSDDWVSPAYPPPMMLLDTNITLPGPFHFFSGGGAPWVMIACQFQIYILLRNSGAPVVVFFNNRKEQLLVRQKR